MNEATKTSGDGRGRAGTTSIRATRRRTRMGALTASVCLVAAGAAVVSGAGAAGASAPVPGTAPHVRASQPTPQINGLSQFASSTGRVYMSNDAIGTNDPAGAPVKVHKVSASSTVESAYLLAATTPTNLISDGDVTLNGTPLSFPSTHKVTNSVAISSYWVDVTSIVKPVVDGAAPGDIPFIAAEPNDPGGIDGEILAVIMNDPTLPTDNTVVFEFGALSSSGDTYSIGLADPLNLSDPNLSLTMSIGDSFGYQGPPATGQFSDISVNGTRMTSSAGGNDDSVVKYDATPDYASSGDGTLITVGGIGDSTANPSDPNATDSTCAGGPPRCDDELYNLLPFVHNGDTSISVNTDNPSNDDNIFFTGFELNSTAAVVGEGAVLSPVSGSSPVGTAYTFTGKLQKDDGSPIVGRAVTFTVVSGPNAGLTFNTTTDAAGQATFTDTSATAGTDDVVLTFTGSDGSTISSNDATVLWTSGGSCTVTAPRPDGITSTNQRTPSAVFTARGLHTTQAGDLILAFIEADGPHAPTQEVTSVTGGGLHWTLAVRSNATWGTTEVWQAVAPAALTAPKIKATLRNVTVEGSMTVVAFRGASGIGATAAGAGLNGKPMATVTPQSCNSLVWAAGHDWTHNAVVKPANGQFLVKVFNNGHVHDTFYTQKVIAPTTTAPVTVLDKTPTLDRWTLAAVEIRGL